MNETFILEEVGKQLDAMSLGFKLSAEDMKTLDEPEQACMGRVLDLEDKLPVTVKNELFHVANSPIYRKGGMEQATDFWEVSTILGLDNIKTYIFSSALYGMAPKNPDILLQKQKCLATAGLSMAIMHNILGFNRNIMPRVQLCAMVSEFGKIPFFLYRQKHADDPAVGEIMTENFINVHHGTFGIRMVEKFNLPEYLNDLFNRKSLIFFQDAHEFSVTTIVRMAKLLVRESFKQFGKLVLTSVVDDPHGVVFGSVGTEIQTYFDSLGIGPLLEIVPHETEAQRCAREKKEGKGKAS